MHAAHDPLGPLGAPLLGEPRRDLTLPTLLLLVTILLETIGTLLLKRAFDGVAYTAGAYGCYFSSLSLFSLVLRRIPLSIAYTTWCALGTVGVAVGSCLLYGETLSVGRWACVALTVPCVVGLHVLP